MEERPSNYKGAEPLGLHVEGPFLNLQKKGAHNPIYLQSPDDQLVSDWSPKTGIRLVTLAPELPGAPAMIEELASRGVVVSAGHSMATYNEAGAGFAAGVRYGTHLFNAMPPLGHREPGLVGALLDNYRSSRRHHSRRYTRAPRPHSFGLASQRQQGLKPGQRRHGRPGHAAWKIPA